VPAPIMPDGNHITELDRQSLLGSMPIDSLRKSFLTAF
jgi:hypothetical protein